MTATHSPIDVISIFNELVNPKPLAVPDRTRKQISNSARNLEATIAEDEEISRNHHVQQGKLIAIGARLDMIHRSVAICREQWGLFYSQAAEHQELKGRFWILHLSCSYTTTLTYISERCSAFAYGFHPSKSHSYTTGKLIIFTDDHCALHVHISLPLICG